MNGLNGNELLDSNIRASIGGSPSFVSGKINQAMELNGRGDFIIGEIYIKMFSIIVGDFKKIITFLKPPTIIPYIWLF